MKTLRTSLLALLLVLSATGLWAQAVGTITVIVVDAQGNPMSGVPVTVVSDSSTGTPNFYHQANTNPNGVQLTTVPITNNTTWDYLVMAQACGITQTATVSTLYNPTGNNAWSVTLQMPCNPGGGNCTLSFTSNQFSGLDVWYNATLSGASGPTTYAWDFGDGNTLNTQNASYAHTYAQGGTYTVCCTATVVNTGCQDVHCQTVTVTQPSCLADFTYTINGNVVCFTNTSTGNASNSTWYIDQSNYFNQNTVCHTFPGPGTYYAMLLIEDSLTNCWDSSTVSITIPGAGGCQAYYTYTLQNGVYVFTGQNSGGNPASTTFSWTFPNGTTYTGGTVTVNTPINGVVCLTVSDNFLGCSDTYCDSVGGGVNPGNCGLTFTLNQNGSLVQFTSTISGATPNTAMLNWDFGDGSTSTSYHPTHNYTAPGTYVVCCTLTTASGCQDLYCATVVVSNANTGCNADADFNYYVQGNQVCFQNTSTGTYQNLEWYISGSGFYQTFTGQNNLCVTLPTGNYWAFLAVWDNTNNCYDSTGVNFTIGNPVGNTICVSGQVLTTNNGYALVGVAYLVTLDAATGTLYAVDTTYINPTDSGYYQFCNVGPGFYTVKAHLTPNDPNYATHLPTYLGDELMWYNAATLNLNASSFGNNINLIGGVNPGGPGFISGNVNNGANKTAAMLEGATVIAMDELNAQALVAYSITDAAGAFSFPSLAYGTYRLRTDAINLYAQDHIIVLGPMNTGVDNVEIEMGTEQATAAPEAAVVAGTPSIYPNPASADARIRLVMNTGADVAIRVIDATGRTLHTATEYLPAGNAEVALPAAQFAPGLYYVTVTAASQTFTARLVRN